MAIATIHTWRVREGKTAEFVSICGRAKKLHEQLGGTVRVWTGMFGTEPGTAAYVVQHDDISAYAKFATALQSNDEWQALVQEATAKPTADLVSATFVNEVPGI